MSYSTVTATDCKAKVVLPPVRPPRPERVKVLAVLHSDNWVEIYADKHVDVAIVNRVHAINPASANLVDQVLELSIPRCYRRLYEPVNLRAADKCRKVTAEDVLDTRWQLDLLRELREIGRAHP